MDKARILAIIDYYDAVLGPRGQGNGLQKVPEDRPLVDFQDLELEAKKHLRAMIPEMREMLADSTQDRTEKCMRWLGFIQGVLWTVGDFTLEDLKNHSRPDRPVPHHP